MKGYPSTRTYGIKLLEPKGDHDKIESPVTTRKCDIELFNRTGEVKYIDEEGETMATVDQRANGRRMREEITSLEQFETIGNYGDVARKYQVGKAAAHAYLQSLRAKKAREGKEMPEQSQDVIHEPSLEEIEKFHTDTEPPQELPKVEIGPAVQDEPIISERIPGFDLGPMLEVEDNNKQNIDLPENLCAGALNNITCCECGELVTYSPEHPGSCASCNAEIDKIIKANEAQWNVSLDKVRSYEEIWKSVETDLATLHKMHLERAENDFQARLAGVIEEC